MMASIRLTLRLLLKPRFLRSSFIVVIILLLIFVIKENLDKTLGPFSTMTKRHVSSKHVELVTGKRVPRTETSNNEHANDGSNQIKVLCYLLLSRSRVKTAQTIKETWGSHCDTILFFGGYEYPELGVIHLNVTEGYENLWGKAKAAILYLSEHSTYKFYIKADDDTYFIIENLREFVNEKAQLLKDPAWFGFKLKHHKLPTGYMSGGAGYVYNNAALLQVSKLLKNRSHQEIKDCNANGEYGIEDLELGKCFLSAGVKSVDSTDKLGRERFLPLAYGTYLNGAISSFHWIWKQAWNRVRTSVETDLYKERNKEPILTMKNDEWWKVDSGGGPKSSNQQTPKKSGANLTLGPSLEQSNAYDRFLLEKVPQNKDEQTKRQSKHLEMYRRNTLASKGRSEMDDAKRHKVKIFKALHKFTKQKRLSLSMDSLLEGFRENAINEILSPRPRYKKPIEKLLKRVKQDRIEEIPPYINIHKHRDRQASLIGGKGVRKEIDIILSVLHKHGRKVQPKVGWDYNKRQKRLLLGYRHRKLDRSWRYFEPIKKLFPRHVKPNNHWPDAVFHFINVMIFITASYHVGLAAATGAMFHPLEDLYEQKYFKENGVEISHHSHYFWATVAPLERYAMFHVLTTAVFVFIIILGFVGVYLADQKLHLIYFLGMVACLLLKLTLAIRFSEKDHCKDFMDTVNPLLDFAVETYYEEIPVEDLNGETLFWINPATQNNEPIKIRTYKAANIMDRIQKSLLCCGHNGMEDYIDNNVEIPSSCCTPLWNSNLYCAKVMPFDMTEYRAKFLTSENGSAMGCSEVYETMCVNSQRLLGDTTKYFVLLKMVLFLINCFALVIQTRQIRQLRREPHLRISAGSISQSLQASAGDAGGKGAIGIQVVEASKLTDKQAEAILKIRHEAGLNDIDSDDSNSSASREETTMIRPINFVEMRRQRQTFSEKKPEKKKLSEVVDRQYNILFNKNFQLQSYQSGGGISHAPGAVTEARIAALNKSTNTSKPVPKRKPSRSYNTWKQQNDPRLGKQTAPAKFTASQFQSKEATSLYKKYNKPKDG